jgi:hypothetical protein
MIARFFAWRQRKDRERNEQLAQEVRAAFSAAGGRARARKAREPVRSVARQIRDELGLGEDRRLV